MTTRSFLTANIDDPETIRAILGEDAAEDTQKVEPTFQERLAEEVAPDEFNWVDVVAKEVLSSLINWGDAHGQSRNVMGQIYEQHASKMFVELEDYFSGRNVQEPGGMAPPGGSNLSGFTSTTQGMNRMIEWAINWFGGKAGVDLGNIPSTGRGRGTGRRGPTAEEIRNQFDIEELSRAVNEMNRALVLEDHKDPRKVARQYVDAVVKGKGEKKIDFATFVETRIEKTARYKSIYRNKPEHLSAGQYISPYLQSAQQFAAPADAADIAIGGAQFGASAEQFRSRLQREDSFTGSAPFIQNLEGRMQDLNNVLKG